MAKIGTANLPLHYGNAPAWLFTKMRALSREIITLIVSDYGPEGVLKRMSDPFWFQAFGCVLGFDWHSILSKDINSRYLQKIFLKTYERKPENFEKLLGIEGVGPKTIRALALISELVYGNSPSFDDPARYSFAHGGKDGIPYPVDRKNYDHSIEYLRRTVTLAKIGHSDKIRALKRLNNYDNK